MMVQNYLDQEDLETQSVEPARRFTWLIIVDISFKKQEDSEKTLLVSGVQQINKQGKHG